MAILRLPRAARATQRRKLPANPTLIRQGIMGVLVIVLLITGWVAFTPIRQLNAAGAALDTALRQGDRQSIALLVTQLETLHAEHPQAIHLQRQLAQGYVALNRPQDAVRMLEAAYRLEPANLLVQRELALAYATMQRYEPALWHSLGLDAHRLQNLGDQSLYTCSGEALLWYRTANGIDGRDLGNRILFARALAGDSSVNQDAQGMLYHLDDGIVQIPGGQLRWLRERTQPGKSFGDPLRPNSDTIAKIWWNDHVGALVHFDQPGSYRLSMQVRHAPPAPIEMALGVNGEQLRRVSLGRGDGSSELVSVVTRLERGTHLVGVWYLNDAMVDGVDRNAEVEWVAVEGISSH